MDPLFIEGLQAARKGVEWWENPYPSGSREAYRWDTGHTQHRTMTVALIPEFPLNKGLTRAYYDLIVHACKTEMTDDFYLLAHVFGLGVEASHAAPKDMASHNDWFGRPRYEPGTARYAAFALGYGCGVARWEAGEG